jgi:hypothetical protein
MGWVQAAAASVGILVLSCCGQGGPPEPPTLPGSENAPCSLATARSFLIDDLQLPDGLPVELSVPPDGILDAYNQLYHLVAQDVGPDLPDALERAVAQHHLLWVVTIQTCQDSARSYGRTALRRGLSYSQGSPMTTVRVSPDPFVWSVGEVSTYGIDTSQGIGRVPVAAPFDLEADTADPSWYPGYMVAIHVDTPVSTHVTGTIALAVETEAATPGISEALARTFTDVHAAEPSCPPTCTEPGLGGLLDLFDPNDDGAFDAAEIEASGWVWNLGFRAVLDLLADYMGATVFWPSFDGIDDCHGNAYQFGATEVTVTR